MFVTSCTTSVAFIANYFSQLLPVCTFGIYAAIIVQANFLLAITYFPAIEMIKYKMDKLLAEPSSLEQKHKKLFLKIETFYGDAWTNFVYKFRKVIIGIALVIFIFALSVSF